MAKAKNSMEELARAAAQRIAEARAAGEQLSLLPDEPGRTPAEVATGQVGRPKGALGKGSSQLRDWMVSRGYRLPEEQLVQIAGLDGSGDVIDAAMVKAERILAWQYADAVDAEGEPRLPTPEARGAVFAQVFASMLRASEALLPYGTPKAAAETGGQPVVQIVMPGAAPDRAASARDVTPPGAARDPRMRPADVRYQMQQNQGVSDASDGASDGEGSDG